MLHNPAEKNSPSVPVALTMGDPAGIGPDITLLAWKGRSANHIFPFVVLGNPELYISRAAMLGMDVNVTPVSTPADAMESFATALPVLPVSLSRPVEAGKPDMTSAEAIITSIKRSVDLVYSGDVSALVTNPINKKMLYTGGFEYPGHTEFMGALAEQHGDAACPVMMLACEELRAVPATVHIPLKDVPSALTRDRIIQIIKITSGELRHRFDIASPRIAVTGLNPHAGEEGSLGTEEREVIAPAIKELQASGMDVTGPWPADTIFQARLRAGYDAIVTMYHDQALIPVKTLAFDKAVNVTLGLPFIRTSPDHGTAYELAGTSKASPASLIEAIKLAEHLGSKQMAET